MKKTIAELLHSLLKSFFRGSSLLCSARLNCSVLVSTCIGWEPFGNQMVDVAYRFLLDGTRFCYNVRSQKQPVVGHSVGLFYFT